MNKDLSAKYARQIQMDGFGIDAQSKLLDAHVLIVGIGGLGSTVAEQLVRSGIGKISLVDHDSVGITNLHRQVLYDEGQIGRLKTDAASERLKKINSQVKVLVHSERLSLDNWKTIFTDSVDLVIESSDNFQTKYLVNDLALRLGIPFVYGAVNKMEGQVTTCNVKNDNGDYTGNLRDCFPNEPYPGELGSCELLGVIGPMVGLIASQMSLEAVKLITGFGTLLSNKLLTIDGLNNREFRLKYKPSTIPINHSDWIMDRISWIQFSNDYRNGNWILYDVRTEREKSKLDKGGERIDDIELLKHNIERGAVFYCKTGQRAFEAYRTFKKRFPSIPAKFVEDAL